jgi:hypothetical protein
MLAAVGLGAAGSVACGVSEGDAKIPLVGDVGLTCFETGCFDGDDCTDDLCQADGVCLFVASNPQNACLEDFHCVRSRCFAGTCQVDSCGNLRCKPDHVDFCMECDSVAFPCDDGDPCTRDACDLPNGVCTFEPAGPQCLPWCSSSNALGVADAEWVGEGFSGSFRGRIVPYLSRCETGCECDQPMAMTDRGVTLRLLPNEEGPPLTCRVSTCGETVFDCAPYASGRYYFALGRTAVVDTTGKDAQAPGAPAEPPRLAANALLVESLCPAVNIEDDALFGLWRAHLEQDGVVAAFDLAISRIDRSPIEIEIAGNIERCEGCEAFGVTVGERAFVGELRTEDGRLFGTLSLEPVVTADF